MNNTIVYAKQRADFSIISSELLALITGGLQRIASRQEAVIMDGSGSADPDEPRAKDFRCGHWQLLLLIKVLQFGC